MPSLDFVVDHHTIALHQLFLAREKTEPDLPAYDVAFCAIDVADETQSAIDRAILFTEQSPSRVLNDPRRLRAIGRTQLAATIRGVPGCHALPARRLSRSTIIRAMRRACVAGRTFPGALTIRPVDTHRGEGLARVATWADLAGYLERTGGDAFVFAPFVDYRSPDSWSRKYRMVIVDGVPYPFHLAIAEDWIVHYFRRPAPVPVWMDREEARFVRDPASVFPHWPEPFHSLANAVGLDYFGVDCTLLPNGDVLIFECGTNMFIHDNEPIRAALTRFFG